MRTPGPDRRHPRPSRPVPWLLAGVVVALLASGVGLWRFSSGKASALADTYPMEVSVVEAAAKRAAGAFVLDVRQPEEWAEAHIPGSRLIPLGELPRRIGEIPREGEIVVVCRSGNRSRAGRDILRQAGFARVTSMAGGLRQWVAAGHPTVRGQ